MRVRTGILRIGEYLYATTNSGSRRVRRAQNTVRADIANRCAARLGTNYNTNWARTPVATAIRSLLIDTVGAAIVNLVTTPTVLNRDLLDELDGPVIFTPNHSSHLDTTLILTVLPKRFRHRAVIAAGADYWFDTPMKARAAAGLLNIIPIERERVDRKSVELATRLIKERWNVIIFPEGTRTRDGFAGPFRGGAAYLSLRTGIPIVPVHIEGTRRVFGVGASHATPGPTRVVFGNPIYPAPNEKSRILNERIEVSVSVAADEGRTDWWSALRRRACHQTPRIQGPDDLVGWRRNWIGSARVVSHTTKPWPLRSRSGQ